jgi:hypothetical protein
MINSKIFLLLPCILVFTACQSVFQEFERTAVPVSPAQERQISGEDDKSVEPTQPAVHQTRDELIEFWRPRISSVIFLEKACKKTENIVKILETDSLSSSTVSGEILGIEILLNAVDQIITGEVPVEEIGIKNSDVHELAGRMRQSIVDLSEESAGAALTGLLTVECMEIQTLFESLITEATQQGITPDEIGKMEGETWSIILNCSGCD